MIHPSDGQTNGRAIAYTRYIAYMLSRLIKLWCHILRPCSRVRLSKSVQPCMGYSEHEFASIPIAAVHNNTGSVRVRVTLKYEQFLCTVPPIRHEKSLHLFLTQNITINHAHVGTSASWIKMQRKYWDAIASVGAYFTTGMNVVMLSERLARMLCLSLPPQHQQPVFTAVIIASSFALVTIWRRTDLRFSAHLTSPDS